MASDECRRAPCWRFTHLCLVSPRYLACVLSCVHPYRTKKESIRPVGFSGTVVLVSVTVGRSPRRPFLGARHCSTVEEGTLGLARLVSSDGQPNGFLVPVIDMEIKFHISSLINGPKSKRGVKQKIDKNEHENRNIRPSVDLRRVARLDPNCN
ncbi:hypothetical protein B0T19DRAFT_260428 [Cercophora scortea]|uniref:Uncharacterized protein n=1 Tax=Cercophora scortea TaxID=314031 RepID=A0AAE0I9V0_9PEZI|nr:hypothetical protein B0T19DRAFT_260428 [Cercophora scortea]